MESTETQPQGSELSLKERFFRNFQQEVAGKSATLQEEIDRLGNIASGGEQRNDAIDHCLAGIEQLSHEVKDASSYITAYDQRTYSESIKALSDKLQKTRSSFAPKTKFSFKNARKSASTMSPAEDKSNVEVSSANQGESKEPVSAGSASKPIPSPSNSTNPSISNHYGTHIIRPPSSSDTASSGTLFNIHRSVIDLSPRSSSAISLASLHMKDIKESLIICGQISGPAHITDVSNSVIVVACRQFRMHGSKNVDIYLHCSSRPIIEDCEGVRFAPLPEYYLTEEIEATVNHWDQIDDFKWLKAEPSPHWNILPAEERLKEQVWKDVVPGAPGVGCDEILKAVGVSCK